MLPFVWQGANGVDWVKMAAIAFVGTTGQLLLIRALRLGEASMLAPFSYTGLIFAILWGALFYNEFPDQWTLIGAVIIAAAGIYVWYRETFRK
jgi:drug/metabolite transporter (DMT)-like permease